MVLLAVSCVDPELATPTTLAYGDWEVVQYYVNGQNNGVNAIERFTLEKNNNFVLEDQNGILISGTWSAMDNQLSLNGSDGNSFALAIVFQSTTKMHLTQEVSSSTVGSFIITYLFRKT